MTDANLARLRWMGVIMLRWGKSSSTTASAGIQSKLMNLTEGSDELGGVRRKVDARGAGEELGGIGRSMWMNLTVDSGVAL